MFRRKKSKATKTLAIFLAILLVAYNVPIGISSTGFAQNEAFTLQILNNGVPVANKEVSAHNDRNEVSVTGTTDSNGVVSFPELTKATFGQNNQFQFTVEGNTFSRVLTEGTTENVIYDLSTKTFQHTVTVHQTGSGTVKVNGADYTGPVRVNEKSNVSISITPDTGYEIKSVTIGGKSETVSDKENYSGAIADISTDTTVDVQFILKTYTITFNSDPQGTIQDGANQTIDNKGGTVTVQQGADSSFTVIPNTGYHVAMIKMDGNPIDLSKDVAPVQNGFQYTFKNVTSNHRVEVSFAVNTYEVSAKVNGGNGTVSPNQTAVDYGGEVQLTMTPANSSYQVSSITINGTDVPNLANDSNFVENDDGSFTYTVKNITSVTSIQVTFAGVPLLDQHWGQYVSFTPTSGSLARSYTEGKNDILVFSKDAVVDLSAKAPYNQVDMNVSGWQDKVTLSSDTTINRLLVRTNHGKNREEVNLNGGSIMVVFDKNAPTAKITAAPKDNNVTSYHDSTFSGDATFHVDVQDPESGVNKVEIDVNGQKFKEYDFSNEKNVNPAIDSFSTSDFSTIPINPDGSYVVTVTAVDNAGNQMPKADKTIYIDRAAPTLDNKNGKAVTFETKNDSTFARVLNFFSFGTFFNKHIDVTVKAKDDAAIGGASGVQKISLKTSDPKVVPQEVAKSFTTNGKTAEAKFTLDVDSFKGNFNVELTDNVNNKRTVAVTSGNSNMKGDSGIVLIEKNKPSSNITVSTKDGSQAYVDDSQHEFYHDDVTYHVEVNDQDSGVNAVTLDVNGKSMTDQPYFYDDKDKATYKTDNILPVPTKDATIQDDGSYVLTVHEIDNAGNENTESKTVYIDRTSPKITNIAFSSDDGKQGDPTLQKDIKDSVEPTDYGFFFKKPTKVTVTAEDPTVKSEATSKVKSETIYLKDYENGKYYAIGEGGKLIGIAHADVDKIAAVPTTRDVTFYVPENFKGQIFAKASDHVNNTSAYQSPMGEIVENEAQHAKSSSISLDKEPTTFKDNNGLDLYAKNVPVNIKVADSYSGIAKVEWSVVAPHDTANNQSGTAVIDFAKNVSGDAGWNITKTDQNLITEMTKTILVNNDSNNIVLHVKLTDQAGNTSEKELTFSIDKTAPKLEVTYDNNTPDSQYTDYYKEDRTAKIVVTERNFRPEDVQYEITNKDGSVPKLVGWTTVENAQDPNQTAHIATVRYSTDGDYTFTMSYKDNAGNAAAPFHEQKFTLDKTIPVITVSYSNNAVSNGDYYKAARTATVEIKEHNFDPSRVKVEGTASDNGNAVAFPQVSGWSTNGDIHTATIHYGADAKYSFDIDFMDKAGNLSADYKPDQFIVDQTAPALTISGVKDKSANNGDVIPVISYSDTNFNKNGVTIKLSGANRGNVTPDGSFADAPNGQTFTFKNFAKEKIVDDIYTLTANLVDFAGNQTTQTIQFSVNRFGSVYVFDDSLKKIEGKYVKYPKDVVVTETNVDALKPETVKVKMTKNGTPTDLTAGKDYTLTHAGGDGKWSQYKYVVKKSLFADDGKYSVSLFSEDAAGNINENIDESKKAEISFGIDQTAPVVIPVDFESGKQYPVDKKSVSVSIKDNLVLKDAKIYLNGKKVAQKVDGENYTFTIPSSNSKQNVKIVAVDAAGNEHVKNVNDFLVSTNPLVRLYNNTPLFMGSIGGVGVAGFVATYLVARKMRKEEEDD